MGSQNTLTDDLVPPKRPGIDDLGGGAKVNTTDPPDTTTGLRAEDWNQVSKQIAALRKTLPLLIVSVRFAAGNPVIDSATAVGGGVVPALSIARTGGGAGSGDTTISWPPNTIAPQNTSQPWALVLNDLLGTNRAPSGQAVSNGVRVVTTNGAGAATDIPYTVTIG